MNIKAEDEIRINYEKIRLANETIITTNIKGKDYAEVNQRIKAFRMVYPQGFIETEMLSNEDGVCIFHAIVGNDEKILGTGTAYEKENSTFINKTSYIENCETSAVGRALGMAGFGIDTSVASAEEVQNAIANQNMTQEDAENYKLNFGKYSGKTLKEINELDSGYMDWLLHNGKTQEIRQMVSMVSGKKIFSDEEWEELLDLQTEMQQLIRELSDKDEDFHEGIIYEAYKDKEHTKEVYNEIITTLKKKLEA